MCPSCVVAFRSCWRAHSRPCLMMASGVLMLPCRPVRAAFYQSLSGCPASPPRDARCLAVTTRCSRRSTCRQTMLTSAVLRGTICLTRSASRGVRLSCSASGPIWLPNPVKRQVQKLSPVVIETGIVKLSPLFNAASKRFMPAVATDIAKEDIPVDVKSEIDESANDTPGVHPALRAFQTGTLGFGFSAGGLVFPYFIGVMQELEDLGIIRDDTPLAGASAGSLIVACHRAGVSNASLLEGCLELAKDCRDGGTRFRLRSVLSKHLFDRLPHDAHERCSGATFIAVTRVWPVFTPMLVSKYETREDLIQAMLTSCHIPWYFDGKLVVRFRDGFYADGGITQFIPRPPADHVTKICCFPSQQLKSFSGIEISPDTFEPFPHSITQMLQWALEPAAEEILQNLAVKGRQDAKAWALSTGILAHIQAGTSTAPTTDKEAAAPTIENITKATTTDKIPA